jgi:hypothetical protein
VCLGFPLAGHVHAASALQPAFQPLLVLLQLTVFFLVQGFQTRAGYAGFAGFV